MNQFDHFVLAAPALTAAKAEFAELSGCTPADGGAHTGLGTHNALCAFGEHSYLEIVAPDPEQNSNNPFTSHLGQLQGSTPLHWAIRTEDLPAVAQQARQLGLATGPVRDTARRTPAGATLNWQLMGLTDHGLGGLVPFFIDWKQCPHPATTSPQAGTVSEFTVSLPDKNLVTLLSETSGVEVRHGSAAIRLVVASANGDIEYSAASLHGFTL